MKLRSKGLLSVGGIGFASLIIAGCGGTTTTTTTNTALGNSGTATYNSSTNAANANLQAAAAAVDAREPEQYQAKVTVKFQATGDQQVSAAPTLAANVARSGNDRRMEFMMPAGGRVVFLDKGGTNYLIMPDKKQYAELTPEAVGFEIRRMMMPEQIVKHAKGLPGVKLVGEEQLNGRTVLKYEYGSVTNTQSQAGQVATQAYILVDKETGLPLRSETTAESQSGGTVQGFSGLRVLTEISDINMTPEAGIFDMPEGLQKIDASQVRAQVDMVFNALASFAAQMMKQGQPQQQPASSPASSPAN